MVIMPIVRFRVMKVGCWRALVLCGLITLIHRKDPLFPSISRAQSIISVFTEMIFNISQLAATLTKELEIFSEILDSLEARNECQQYEALGIHVSAQKHIFAEVVNREVVFPVEVSIHLRYWPNSFYLQLHLDHANEREWFHIWLIRNGSHRTSMHWLIPSIHSVDLGQRICSIQACRIWQRRRS